jgi:uncharacterized membrane protein HdeD (DUF308 family)
VIAMLFGVATLLVWAVSQWAAHDDRRHVDALGVSLMFCVSYLLTNVLAVTLGWPDMIAWFPFLDGVLCAMIYFNWRRHPKAWKAVVMAALVAQLVLHFAATVLWKTDQLTFNGAYLYATLINGAFAIQLLAIGSVGVGHGLGRLLAGRRHLRRVASVADARR